jgi:alpha-aminoadipate/glutamate carrier protein LysW
MTNCPECDAAVAPNTMIAGEIFLCADCGCELEVLGTQPFAVQLAPKVAEDWGE